MRNPGSDRPDKESERNAHVECTLLNNDAVIHDVDIVSPIKDVQRVGDKDTRLVSQRTREQAVLQNRLSDIGVESTQ